METLSLFGSASFASLLGRRLFGTNENPNFIAQQIFNGNALLEMRRLKSSAISYPQKRQAIVKALDIVASKAKGKDAIVASTFAQIILAHEMLESFGSE